MSSPLLAPSKVMTTVVYSFLLVVIGIAIFTSSVFTVLPPSLPPNQYSAFATFPGENGKIAFASQRDAPPGTTSEIYVMNADGSGQTNISNNPATDSHPDWSPDGTKIAFGTNRDGNEEIYVMNADGSGQTRLTNTEPGVGDYYPDWSPDGTKITFMSTRDGNGEIYVMNADGSNPTRLTNNPWEDELPAWSPDGTKIAFGSNRDGDHAGEIYVMNADGSNPTRLTTSPNFDGYPDWSPDGTKIAFSSSRDSNAEIYVMNADGSNPTRLTTTSPANEFITSWSPDGTKIAFDSNKDDDSNPNSGFEIYVMNADGTSQIRLTTTNPANDDTPNWGTATSPEEDTTPPVIMVPEDMVVEATSEQGAEVTYTVTAEDNVDGNATLEEDGTTVTQDDVGGNITMSCDPPSGSVFSIGNTTVECSATDEAGNTGTESFTVTVNPLPPPPPPPDPLTAEIISNGTVGFAPATFEFEANVTGGTEPYTYNWDFGDGSEGSQQQTVVHTFEEAGVYTVTLIVTDVNEQQANDTLQITVNERPPPPPPPRPIPKQVIDELISIIQNLDDNVPQSVKTDIIALLEEVSKILNDNNPNNDESACDELGAFINQVDANERRGTLTADQANVLRTQAEDIIRNELDC
jgi:Tol biopolymer transport system component